MSTNFLYHRYGEHGHSSERTTTGWGWQDPQCGSSGTKYHILSESAVRCREVAASPMARQGIAQKCPERRNRWPQYRFRSAGNSLGALRNEGTSILRTKSLIASLGRTDTKIWTWSEDITPLIIFISFPAQTWRMMSRIRIPKSRVSTSKRYVVGQTM